MTIKKTEIRLVILSLIVVIYVVFVIQLNDKILSNDNTPTTKTELISPTLSMVQNNRLIVLETFETSTQETAIQETIAEEIETECTFKPYEYWYDYNSKTGELIRQDSKPLDDELQKYIYDLCQEKHISFALIMAQIGAESDFNQDTISEVNAVGLMQIRPNQHKELINELETHDLYNPYQNVLTGISLMERLFIKYEDSSLTLMAYNCGSTRANNLWNKGTYSTSYTKEILTVYQKYEEDFGY